MKTNINKCFRENVNTLKKVKKIIRHITDELKISSKDSKKINFPLINPWKSFSNAKNLRSVNFILQVIFYTKKTLLAILRIVFYRLPERVLHDLPLKSYIKRPENCHHQ